MSRAGVNTEYSKEPSYGYCPVCGTTVLGAKDEGDNKYADACPKCGWVDVYECEMCGKLDAVDRDGNLLCSACAQELLLENA